MKDELTYKGYIIHRVAGVDGETGRKYRYYELYYPYYNRAYPVNMYRSFATIAEAKEYIDRNAGEIWRANAERKTFRYCGYTVCRRPTDVYRGYRYEIYKPLDDDCLEVCFSMREVKGWVRNRLRMTCGAIV